MKLNYCTLHRGFLGRHGLMGDRMDRVIVSREAHKGSHLLRGKEERTPSPSPAGRSGGSFREYN